VAKPNQGIGEFWSYLICTHVFYKITLVLDITQLLIKNSKCFRICYTSVKIAELFGAELTVGINIRRAAQKSAHDMWVFLTGNLREGLFSQVMLTIDSAIQPFCLIFTWMSYDKTVDFI